MKLLAIETSTDLASVALLVDGELYSEEQGCIRQHAQMLLPMIERLLIKAAIAIHDLDGIVFGRGPGSFTGLRIACSLAKGLACAHQLPLYPVSTLASIAYDSFQTKLTVSETYQVLVMLDARMNQVYWGCFSSNHYDVDECVSEPSDINLSVETELILAGVGYDPYIGKLPDAIKKRITHYNPVYPHARTLINIVLSGKINAVSADQALPVYVRNQVTQGEKRG